MEKDLLNPDIANEHYKELIISADNNNNNNDSENKSNETKNPSVNFSDNLSDISGNDEQIDYKKNESNINQRRITSSNNSNELNDLKEDLSITTAVMKVLQGYKLNLVPTITK